MDKKVFRLSAVKALTGLSRSAIYDRMDENSPRYDPSFPKKFPLGGAAVGWFKEDIEAWLARCASRASGESVGEAPLVSQADTSKSQSSLVTAGDSQKSSTKSNTPSTPLTQSIFDGQAIINAIEEYLALPEWTAAMGAQIVSGIKPEIGCKTLPTMAAYDFANRPAQGKTQAWRILGEWKSSFEEGEVPPETIEPMEFISWCYENEIETPWLQLIYDLKGRGVSHLQEIAKARIAMFLSGLASP